VTRVSAVIKAKDEAHQINDAIEAARLLADEVIVVDDNSSDDTAAVAEEAGARIVRARGHGGRVDELDKVGFVAARGEWLLRLDADERMTASLADRLRQMMNDDECDAVAYARRNYMFGEWPRHGGWFVSQHVGFFRATSYDVDWTARIHSQVPIRGRLLTLPAVPSLSTAHFDYESVREFAERSLTRYAHEEARELSEAGLRFSPTRLLLRPLRRFFGRYVIRRGFLDGRRGLVLAVLLAAYDMCVESNLWDLQRSSGSSAS
jgi:glycosyltransferase involved in cell wall biosynthesis